MFAPTSHLGHLSAGPFCGTLDVWDIYIGEAMPPSLASALYFFVRSMSITSTVILLNSMVLSCPGNLGTLKESSSSLVA